LFLILILSPVNLLAKLNSSDIAKNFPASLLNLNLAKGLLSERANNQSENGGSFVGLIKNSTGESADFLFIQKSSLIAVASPVMINPQTLGSLTGDLEDDFSFSSRKEIIEYTVQPDDTLTSIATKFGISLETLLWANNLNQKSKIKLGQNLVILPVSGVIHYVKKGDTLTGIAKTYKSEVSKIVAFNELSTEGDIFIGDILIIPDGKLPSPSKQQIVKNQIYPEQIPLASSFFICPVSSPCGITQGLHWYNAIDFNSKCGDPIYAAAGGTVQRVRYGWNGGAGNYLTILHPNNVVTFYGHILNSLVNPGSEVSQGQMIALTGGRPGTPGAGITTGCNLHFEVRGAKNPFAR